MRIGELAERAGVTVKAIRYYDQIGLIAPARQENGYRLFDDDQLRAVTEIRTLGEIGIAPHRAGPFLEYLEIGHDHSDECVSSLAVYRDTIAELDRMISELTVRWDQVQRRLDRGAGRTFKTRKTPMMDYTILPEGLPVPGDDGAQLPRPLRRPPTGRSSPATHSMIDRQSGPDPKPPDASLLDSERSRPWSKPRMFTGLSAFPLTPLTNDTVDERSFAGLIQRLAEAGVDSITALGSTGSYAYLTAGERARIARIAVDQAAGTPVFVGVGALRTSQVLANVRGAEDAGAAGVLLAPMTYQPLTEDDVFELFHTVTDSTELPVIIYDNPGTTRFTFTTGLYGRIAELPGIASIKIPGVPTEAERAGARVEEIRAVIPAHVTIGVSGDPVAAAGLNAGCEAWYSVIGGTLPEPALAITRAAQAGDAQRALTESERLAPLWSVFADLGGSLRVVAAIAEHLGLAPARCLPLPIQGLNEQQRHRVAQVIHELDHNH